MSKLFLCNSPLLIAHCSLLIDRLILGLWSNLVKQGRLSLSFLTGCRIVTIIRPLHNLIRNAPTSYNSTPSLSSYTSIPASTSHQIEATETNMTIRQVIYFGDDRLRQKAKKVKQFTPGLKQLAQDMLETMRHHQGVGLAGPQIGVMQRIFVAEIPLPDDEEIEPHPQSGKSYILINPKVVKSAKTLVEGQEGCLSIPKWRGCIDRPEWVEVRAQDIQGRQIKLKVDDLLARVFMHEIDHLDGVLYIDHIKDEDKLWQVDEEEEDGR